MNQVQMPSRFLKLCGWSLLVGGFLGFTGQLVHIGDTPASIEDIPHFLHTAVNTHVLLAWASILILLGMPAMFLSQSGRLGKLGWAGFPLLFIGMILEIFHGPVQIMAYPIIYNDIPNADALKTVNDLVNNLRIDDFPLSLLVLIPLMPGLFLGLLFLGIGTIRARVLPKWLSLVPLIVFVVLLLGMALPEDWPIFAVMHLVFLLFGIHFASDSRASVSPSADGSGLPS